MEDNNISAKSKLEATITSGCNSKPIPAKIESKFISEKSIFKSFNKSDFKRQSNTYKKYI